MATNATVNEIQRGEGKFRTILVANVRWMKGETVNSNTIYLFGSGTCAFIFIPLPFSTLGRFQGPTLDAGQEPR